MKIERKGQFSPWDIIAAAMAVLLLANFLLFGILCIAAIGMAFDPVLAFLTGVELLLGLVVLLPAKRLKVKKLWRRLLIAGVVCNALIVVFLCAAVILMLAAWR